MTAPVKADVLLYYIYSSILNTSSQSFVEFIEESYVY